MQNTAFFSLRTACFTFRLSCLVLILYDDKLLNLQLNIVMSRLKVKNKCDPGKHIELHNFERGARTSGISFTFVLLAIRKKLHCVHRED